MIKKSECPGFIDSYPIDGKAIVVDLPESSCFWRMKNRHFKIYSDDFSGMSVKTVNDLKKIPNGISKVTITPDHGSYSSNYKYEWE